MCDLRFGRAVLAALGLLLALPSGSALAMRPPSLALSTMTLPPVVQAAQEGPRFHHGRRAQSVYCLRQNRWWFYRPYTTAPEDWPRCEPYFHYLEPYHGRRGARAGRYFK
jgi:hypothetical protein